MAKTKAAAVPKKTQRKVAEIENGSFKNKSGTYTLKAGKLFDKDGKKVIAADITKSGGPLKRVRTTGKKA